MNIKKLKEAIKDLPDDMPVVIQEYGFEGRCYIAEEGEEFLFNEINQHENLIRQGNIFDREEIDLMYAQGNKINIDALKKVFVIHS